MRKTLLMLLLSALGGCSGQYYLTVPDQVAPAGSEAGVVVRLQRNEFAGIRVPMRDAAMRFSVDDGPMRGAYTDKKGYAAAPVPVGNKLGKYWLHVQHMSRAGREVAVYAPTYVWDPNDPVVAVDLDGVLGGGKVRKARQFIVVGNSPVLNSIAERAHIVYFTEQDLQKHADLRRAMAVQGKGGLPDGPIFKWQRQGRIKPRMVSSLGRLRQQFPNLEEGVAVTPTAARAFDRAGLKVTTIDAKDIYRVEDTAINKTADAGTAAAPESQPAEPATTQAATAATSTAPESQPEELATTQAAIAAMTAALESRPEEPATMQSATAATSTTPESQPVEPATTQAALAAMTAALESRPEEPATMQSATAATSTTPESQPAEPATTQAVPEAR